MKNLKVHLLHSVGAINCVIGIFLKEQYCYLNKYSTEFDSVYR